MSHFYPVTRIRACEQLLLDAQTEPDQLMRQAAHAVAVAAAAMLDDSTSGPVLLLVGAGGNGGDALYAGAELLATTSVDAVLLGRDGRVHPQALAAFKQQGGRLLSDLPTYPSSYPLIIDGVLGIGGHGGISTDLQEWLGTVHSRDTRILSVDVPSGVNADTGALPTQSGYVIADVTVTFGGLRPAHGLSASCGEVLLADIGLKKSSLAANLLKDDAGSPARWTARALTSDHRQWPEPLTSVAPLAYRHSLEPGPDEDKYSGGVLGVCAGSSAYPGAAVLATAAAVRATSSMVRYVGSQKLEVVRALPEVVISDSVAETGRVQAWVVGPGRGTGAAARRELEELLHRPEPLLIDADALSILADNTSMRTILRNRRGITLLTPHAGEFRRLSAALDTSIPDPSSDRIGAVLALARDLSCDVLLKGRHTVITTGEDVITVDAGSSWAATPGSGDVLAGIIGAWLARSAARTESGAVPLAVQIHATAAWLAAQTPDGPAPTSAFRIAEAVPQATARITSA
ncbi:bifunctional ADP-dependent NAD(P)H-hydrate dehydratase/NAD(P)H-hydrate epimerase [Corynebacterium alimapuense]|uniref:ADP-dependent (S)-NAD(P)H-hydrate dehydratase n=1 Tax=Corynebacterium alimapuense TaxID=1576874 RepID=A0A3M8K4R8_9CORY|nr:bifunctional ADP-dependent NAD(P)H-hydrate dehydratase/NAD(P)H-hydrate epimerase [Corynebacterium alimapuense]RNE48090.1 bifunctional ADP-dependent (S)-NAD(P)H-hydrate dehydratase/NAD(P)H-hydrate epimerase [Corynebacterium alimapuense]